MRLLRTLLAPIVVSALSACALEAHDPLVLPNSLVSSATARHADGALVVELAVVHDRVADLVDRGLTRYETIEVQTFDADGRLTGTVSSEVNWRLVGRSDSLVSWWPVAEPPAEIIVRVIRPLDEGAPMFTQRIGPVPAPPPAEDRCDPAGMGGRCAEGQMCPVLHEFWSGRDVARRWRPIQRDRTCEPVEVAGWGAPGGPRYVELWTGPGLYDGAHDLWLTADDGGWWSAPVQPVGRSGEAHRWVATVPAEIGPAVVDVWMGPQRIAADMAFRAPDPIPVGGACDPLGVVSLCEPGAVCADEVCTVGSPPVIEALEAWRGGDGVFVTFAARDADADIVGFDIQAASVLGVPEWGVSDFFGGRLWPQSGRWNTGYDGEVHPDGDRVEGWITFEWAVGRGVSRVGIRAIDSLGNSTEHAVDVRGRAPEVAAVGEPCDPFAVETACAGPSICDLADGADEFTCHDPAAACPLPTPELIDRVEGDWPQEARSSQTTCNSRTALAPTLYFGFTAPADGTYVFSARGEVVSLALRRACDLPRGGDSELVCAGMREREVEHRLAAGERVFPVIVRGEAFGDDDAPGTYALSVERVVEP